MSKNIFVLGATGFQGSAIAEQLASNGHSVRTLVSDTDNVGLSDGIKSLSGDLGHIASIIEALEKVDIAVYTFPLIFDMDKAKYFTQNFIDAAKAQNVRFIIFNSSFDIPQSRTGLLGLDIKYEIKRLFDNSELKVLTLMPDIYLNNLAAPWSIPLVVEKNILPYPIKSDKRVPWISHRDLAHFVAAAVEKPELVGQNLPIGGTLLSGEEIAASISEYLGQEINFISLKPDDFEKQLIHTFGELNAKEISNLYRYVEKENETLVGKNFSRTQDLLGVKPSSVKEWVRSVNWSVS
ncbi:NAD-dependent epimerase/dehydratase family protein [Aggregatimonas sangjinii]|uniref:NAD-dependent epimerase/dehydratase family protein n=1 Tax=Aggregatimonas sangjinii TaxID=2583587 RepID=A0A5B7SW74_9FLAO|nr:NmrA family NAD(P)-binding protein [Aggregatimonas sangjinii]QCX01569.1 NAD-dependent epimerase/dehydratase family protein [Aggregatimonas sangjinii]